MTKQRQPGSVVDGSDTQSPPNYETVDIPATPPSEFTYHERRADLLQQVSDLGHPSMINQVEAAERYGVSQQQISKDLDRIAESVHEHIVDRDRRRGGRSDTHPRDVDHPRARYIPQASRTRGP